MTVYVLSFLHRMNRSKRKKKRKKNSQSTIKCLKSHPVFHWFLHKVEALPAGVKLMFVRTFEVQQVADNLKGVTDKNIDLSWIMRLIHQVLATASEVEFKRTNVGVTEWDSALNYSAEDRGMIVSSVRVPSTGRLLQVPERHSEENSSKSESKYKMLQCCGVPLARYW